MGDIKHTVWTRAARWWWNYETRVLQAFIALGVVGMLLLGGCASYSSPYATEPGNFACVYVKWTALAEIQGYCPRGAEGCATVGDGKSLQTIWTRRPEAFDDFDAVYNLGHEFLHSLGARHK